MDYQGWQDQKLKPGAPDLREILTQLWVAEFCRANGIECVKDTSSPYVADDRDLSIYGHSVDVKTTVNRNLLGQVSPGVINKPCDYFCFLMTDSNCSFVEPIGFMDCDTYRAVAVEGEGGANDTGDISGATFQHFILFTAPSAYCAIRAVSQTSARCQRQ